MKVTEGMIVEQRRLTSIATPKEVFAVFAAIGGKRGWYYANWLWRLRALLDQLVGGVGMRQGSAVRVTCTRVIFWTFGLWKPWNWVALFACALR